MAAENSTVGLNSCPYDDVENYSGVLRAVRVSCWHLALAANQIDRFHCNANFGFLGPCEISYSY